MVTSVSKFRTVTTFQWSLQLVFIVLDKEEKKTHWIDYERLFPSPKLLLTRKKCSENKRQRKEMCVWESGGFSSPSYSCLTKCVQGKCLPVPHMSWLSFGLLVDPFSSSTGLPVLSADWNHLAHNHGWTSG
jgi:hypothetical protein